MSAEVVLCTHKTTILCQFGLIICHQLPNHISINSQPFLVGIVSFTEHFSPVINDVTFRIVLTTMILEGLDARVIDIDNAFLNGDLDHEIFMKMPERYKECIQDYEGGKA